MAGVKGNKNALGNKGGGRKSAYQEKQDANRLEELLFNELDRKDLQSKLDSGIYSAYDVIKKLVLVDKNERLLSILIQKLFPDLSKLSGEGKAGEILLKLVKYGKKGGDEGDNASS